VNTRQNKRGENKGSLSLFPRTVWAVIDIKHLYLVAHIAAYCRAYDEFHRDECGAVTADPDDLGAHVIVCGGPVAGCCLLSVCELDDGSALRVVCCLSSVQAGSRFTWPFSHTAVYLVLHCQAIHILCIRACKFVPRYLNPSPSLSYLVSTQHLRSS
jgi:hypothetical protein